MAETHLDKLKSMLRQVDPELRTDGPASLERGGGATRDAGGSLRGIPEGPDRAIAFESMEALKRDDDLDGDQRFALEAIVMPYHRPVVDILGNKMVAEHLENKWRHLAADPLRSGIEKVFLAIGRINVPHLPSLPYAGTGFVVGASPNNPGHHLLMTNRHVAAIFAQGVGRRNSVSFRPGSGANIDFFHENGRTQSESLKIEKVLMIHPHMDMAILEVKGLAPERTPLTLGVVDPAELKDRDVVVVGYPGYDPNPNKEFQRIQDRIFRSVYYVKRLQPGQLRAVTELPDRERGRNVAVVTHDSSTLGGNSGSAVLLLPKNPGDPVQVIALHFAGEYLVANYAVPARHLAQDARVVDTGVGFAETAPLNSQLYDEVWRTVDIDGDAGQARESGSAVAVGPQPQVQTPGAVTVQPPTFSFAPQQVEVMIPLRITVSLGTPQPIAPQPVAQRSLAPSRGQEGLFGFGAAPAPPVPQTRFSAASLAKTEFAWDKALSLALASLLSYQDGAAVAAEVRSAWRLQSSLFIERDETECFVTSSNGIALAAFRGTAALRDWLANLNMFSTRQTYGDVHQGFHAAFLAVKSQLTAELRRLNPTSVVLTGHSLGGALATIAAAEWQGVFPISAIYTYGQPAVGKGTFPGFINQNYGDRFFRFVNDDDIVPQVPPTYVHAGKLVQFDASGAVTSRLESLGAVGRALAPEGPSVTPSADPPTMSETEFDLLRAQLLQQRAQERAAARGESLALEAPRLEGFLPSISDHSLSNYLAKIAAKVRS